MNIRGVRISYRLNGILLVLGIVLIYSVLRMAFIMHSYILQPTNSWLLPPALSRRQERPEQEAAPPDRELMYYWKHNGADRRVHVVDCSAILEGDPEQINYAKTFSKYHPRTILPDKRFIDLTQNCTEFKLKRGYALQPLSNEEKEFPIAFSILFYKELQVLERLLRAIYRPQNVYCLHLDRKSSDIVFLSAQALARCFDNVFLASKLESIVYAGYTRLQADVNCMMDVLQKHKAWKYYINLASQAFPLKTNQQIVKILKVYNGSNDIEGMDDQRLLRSRFGRAWQTVTSKPRGKPFLNKTTILKTKPPMNISIVRGSAYGIFSRDFVDFIVNNRYSKALLEWSRDTYSPDEHFWSTLHHLQKNPHLRTPGGYEGVPDKKPWLAVYASWGRASIDPCFSGHFVRGVCIFGVEDFPALVERKELFANKFYPNFESVGLDCLEEWLYNQTRAQQAFNTVYYRRAPFINRPVLAQPTKRPKKKKEQQKVEENPRKMAKVMQKTKEIQAKKMKETRKAQK